MTAEGSEPGSVIANNVLCLGASWPMDPFASCPGTGVDSVTVWTVSDVFVDEVVFPSNSRVGVAGYFLLENPDGRFSAAVLGDVTHRFRVRTTPEPASNLFLAAGLLLSALRRLRRSAA